MSPNIRAYSPEAPITPSKYPRLDHLLNVTDSNDQPITIEAVRTGITDERMPDSLHEI